VGWGDGGSEWAMRPWGSGRSRSGRVWDQSGMREPRLTFQLLTPLTLTHTHTITHTSTCVGVIRSIAVIR
jgi:hypothetical protein